MNRLVVFALVVGMVFAGATALADPGHGDDPFPEHPHVLVLGLEFDETGEVPIAARKCIDLAANRALPLHAHHRHVHFGTAGEALFVNAGHGVAPTAPFPGVPWTDCASLREFFGI